MRFLEVADGDDDDFRLTKDFHENDIPRHYAVLSHTWGEDGDEVTFQDMQDGSGIDKPGFEKIRFCARQARCDGIKYFWIDTCCINKNNQFELSKSIVSMFRWYQRAEKCYVYLSDVPRDSKEPVRDTENWEKDFCESRWFKRGWTLQELLAPASVEFFSRHGVRLGDKADLERQIREVTNIPVAALRGRPLSSFSKHERFSWQRSRQKKEEEDIVYSLIGIFDVSMPVLYGEGKGHARTRLDREIDIARKGPDHESFSVTFASPEVAETAHFVARKSELREIHKALSTSGARRGVTVHGLGGMGKTQLAIAYAMQYKDDYSAVFWVNAKDEDSLKVSFGNIAKQIAREHSSVDAIRSAANSLDRDEAVDAVKRWLSLANNNRWLIIYDNYDNPKIPGNTDPFALDLRKYLPESHHGCLIVTTRSSEVRFGQQMRIRKLETVEDSLAILSHHSGRAALVDDVGALELVKKLDGLPLALATAGAYLRQTSITFAEYYHLYEASWAKLHQTSPSVDSYEDKQLYSTWQISFDQIQQRNEAAAQLLRLWAYFDNEDIWYELLCYKDANTPSWLVELTDNKLNFNRAIRVLCDHGIVDAHPPTRGQSNGYSMHSCVHSWTRDVLNAEPDEDLARTALFCVANLVPTTDSAEWWVVQRRLFNHANRQLHEHASAGDDASWVFHELGRLYNDQGKLLEAEKMYNRALHGEERELGTHHMSTLGTVHNLGNLYANQGKLLEAEKMYNRALQGFERELGSDHTSTLSTVNHLGLLYWNQGKLLEAEKMYNRALHGYEKALRPDHPDTLDTVHNLGILYSYNVQDKLSEAEELFQRALQGYERAYGPDYPATLDTVHSLGLLYDKQGKLAEAEEMYQRALHGYEKALGPDHPSTLDTVHDLGFLYEEQGKLVEAEEMYQRALHGCEKALGPDHPSTLSTVHNLGNLYSYSVQDKLSEAEGWYQRALHGRERTCGADHSSTLATVHNLGVLCKKQGKLLEAEELYQRALQGCERTLGPHHAKTLDTVYEIGRLYAKQGRLSEAEQMYRRLLLAQDHLSRAARDDFAIFEEELRALGSDMSLLRRVQASDSSQGEEEPEASDQSHSDGGQRQHEEPQAQASDEGAHEDARAPGQRRHRVRNIFRRFGKS